MSDPIEPTKRRKKLKEIVEGSPLVVYGTLAAAAFAAGVGSYKGLLEITNQETVIKGSYVLLKDVKSDAAKPTDAGQDVIRRFYSLLNGRRFEEAWTLIHHARKAEVQATLPNAEAFGKIYDTTIKHDNLRVELEKNSPTEATYSVSFDVSDNLPRNEFFEYQGRLVKELFDRGLLDRKRTLDTAFDNIGLYYDITENERARMERMIEETRIESLFSPMFVTEAARALGLPKKPQYDIAPMRKTWRHYILELTLMPEDGDWKIRSGLYPADAVGTYGAGAKVPSK